MNAVKSRLLCRMLVIAVLSSLLAAQESERPFACDPDGDLFAVRSPLNDDEVRPGPLIVRLQVPCCWAPLRLQAQVQLVTMVGFARQGDPQPCPNFSDSCDGVAPLDVRIDVDVGKWRVDVMLQTTTGELFDMRSIHVRCQADDKMDYACNKQMPVKALSDQMDLVSLLPPVSSAHSEPLERGIEIVSVQSNTPWWLISGFLWQGNPRRPARDEARIHDT